MFKSIRFNGKKLFISTVIASSLFILPDAFTHKTFAAEISISTTHEILNLGDVNSDVKALQTKLKSLNYYSGSLDGIYGQHTKYAVRNYQSDQHLTVDGVAGPNTLSKLFSGTSTSTSTSTTSPTLRVGSHGSAVTNVQNQLKDLGYLKGSVDGVFGSVTKSAVVSFQKNNGLTADGVVGPHTYAVLSGSPKAAGTTLTTSRSISSSTPVASIIKNAMALQGTPYVWGGTTPSGFDCSGFIQYVFAKNGVSLPRTTEQQMVQGQYVSTPKVGDLVFFNTDGTGVSHAGIYIGNNKFVNASTSHGVTVSSMDNSYWKPKFIGARRY